MIPATSLLRTVKPKRIVLVDAYWTRDKDPRIPLGHASLLAALRERTSVDVRPVVVAVNEQTPRDISLLDRVLAETSGLSPSDVIVACGVYVWSEAVMQNLMTGLRARGCSGRIVLGGPQISYCEANSLELHYPEADLFVRGNGEEAICAIALGAPPTKGMHFAGSPDKDEKAALSLDGLPSPWLTKVVPLANQWFVRWETKRGCPYRCSFCQHRDAGASRPAKASPERIRDEIALFRHAGVSDIAVLDPVFNDPGATEILESFLAHGYRGRLSLQCRAEQLTEPFLDVAARLDVCLELGIQTTNEAESRAVRRRINLAQIEERLRWIRERNIDHEVSIIFALPTQTLESFKATVRWCLAQRVPTIHAFPLLLLRGTELERDRDEWALEDDPDEFHAVIASNTFSREDRVQMRRISDALHATQGNHPATLEELMHHVPETETPGRFSPNGPSRAE